MVSCKQCNTLNSLDSTFCKRCGTTLELNDIAEAAEKLTAMIADGNKLFADGRTEEAMMVAETAVANNPSSAAAISLKGMVHERKGQIAEALECFEKVVELNPDSTLDKIKVNDLRNLLVAQKIEAPKPDRRVAMVAAVAATVLVIAGGAIAAKAMSKPSTATDSGKLVALNGAVDPGVHTFGDILGNSNSNTNTPNNGGQAQTNQGNQGNQANTGQDNGLQGGDQYDPNADEGTSNNGYGTRRPNNRIRLQPWNGGNYGLPEVGGDGGTVAPLQPKVEGPIGPYTNSQGGNKNPNPGVSGKDPDPKDLPPDSGPTTKTTPPKNDPDESPGIIEITTSKGQGNPNRGGGDSAPTGNGREALVQAARSQMMSGDYKGAANSYERALRAGADPSSTYQRLGQCYERMGRNSDAIMAYQRAASSLEAAIGSGSGDKSALQSRLDSCRQAIKVLGG